MHISAYDRRDDSANVYYKPWNYHCHYTSTQTCKLLAHWRDATYGGQQIAISSALSTNSDQGSIIDDYHGITTSVSRQAYVAWTDHREPAVDDYDIRADRTTS